MEKINPKQVKEAFKKINPAEAFKLANTYEALHKLAYSCEVGDEFDITFPNKVIKTFKRTK